MNPLPGLASIDKDFGSESLYIITKDDFRRSSCITPSTTLY